MSNKTALQDQILEAIKKKAEEKFEVVPHPNLPQIIMDRYEPLRVAYTSGYKDAIEMMPDLLKWWDANAVRNGEDEWTVGAGRETKRYTTDQLLSEYIKTLNNG